MFLEKDILTYVPDATMAFAGGSLFANGGTEKTSQSDYDIVVLAPHRLYAPSYNNVRSEYDGRKMDLIVRDPETLAHELEYARYSGDCSIPSIIATGQQIMGDPAKGTFLQSQMSAFLNKGTDPMDRSRYTRLYDDIRGAFDQTCDMNADERYLSTLEAVHNMAYLHVRYNRHWVAKGKMLGRYLLDFPEFKQKLESAYQQGVPATMMRFLDVNQEALPVFTDPFVKDAMKEKNENIRDRFLVPISSSYSAQIIKNGSSDQKRIVREFLGNKTASVTGAVNPERIGRKSNEYFYALTRLVLTMTSITEIMKGVNASDRHATLIQEFPQISNYVRDAEAGNPVKLKGLAMEVADTLSPNAEGLGIRVVPGHFRRDGSAFIPLIG